MIRAALAGGAERVVQTSSIAAVRPDRESSAAAPYTEADWTDPSDTARTPYVRSKTIAEQAAWSLVRDSGAEDRFATVCPGAIIGPALNDDHSFSLQTISRLLGGMPAVPRLGFTFVDARNVAGLHILAMTEPGGGGERFIAADRFLWMAEVAAVLRERLGDDARKVPTRTAPDLLIRAMGIFDRSVRSVVGDLGRQSWFSSEKARSTLGWTTLPVEDSITDCGRSLL